MMRPSHLLLALPLLLAAPPLLAQEAPPAPSSPPAPLLTVPAPAGPDPLLPPQPLPYVPGRMAPLPAYSAPVARTPDRPDGPMNWYGWQTLLAVAPFDIAMFVGIGLGNGTGGTQALYTGLIGRSLAPAVVHMAHGRVGTAFGSIGLHAGMTAAGLAIGFGLGIALENHNCPPLNPCRNNFVGTPDGPLPGAIVGSMSATILDVVFFNYRQRLSWTASSSPPVDPNRPAWAMAPYAAPGGGGLAATGTF